MLAKDSLSKSKAKIHDAQKHLFLQSLSSDVTFLTSKYSDVSHFL
jgi:hypothetical protein